MHAVDTKTTTIESLLYQQPQFGLGPHVDHHSMKVTSY